MILWKRLFHNICIDKMKALFPIKKEYVKKIFDGSKAYEYRKSFCSLEVDTIVIYESRGKGLVVGEFEIADRLCDTPRNIWERTKGYAGISESDFFSYFEGRDKACAYVVGNVNVFKEKVSRKFGDFRIHCMMDEIGKLHPQNVKGILDFANARNILLINSSPTTYNVSDYRYTYLLSKDGKSQTVVHPLISQKETITDITDK